MKKILLLLFILTVVLNAKETCYTVELISAKENEANKQRLLKIEHEDASCKMMSIAHYLTVRCGCFEKYVKAKEHLKKFTKSYKDAYVRTTYKSRFEPKRKKENTTQIITLSDTNATKQTTVSRQKTPKVEEVPIPTEKLVIQDETTKKTLSRNTPKNKSEKNVVKKKKKKKKKAKKNKIVKKPEAHYSYQRYLKPLSNKIPLRPYDYLYSFGGELSYDLGYVDQKPAKYQDYPQPYFNNKWRRVRLDHKGSFFDKKLFYELEFSLTGRDSFKDVYLGYQDKLFLKSFYRIKAGNIKIPYSLQRYTTLKNLSFMERPLGDDAFSIKRKLGIEVMLHTKIQRHNTGLFLAGYGNSLDELKRGESNKPGYSVRGAYTYKISKRNIFHAGAAFLEEDYKQNTLRYRQKSESNILEEKYVSTKIKNVDTRSVRTVDLLYLDHKYYIETAYMGSTVNAQKGDYRFSSYFVEGSFFLIGEGKRFNAKEAKFSRVKVTRNTALELAFRYSYIDLNDKDEHGGEQTDYNFSLNWYVTPELRLLLNYIRALPKDTDEYDGLINIYQMRILFVF